MHACTYTDFSFWNVVVMIIFIRLHLTLILMTISSHSQSVQQLHTERSKPELVLINTQYHVFANLY